jgi:hypothetical protein
MKTGRHHIYFGKPVEKPYIGDALRPVDIGISKKQQADVRNGSAGA